MLLKVADLGPALLFCPGDRPDRFKNACAAADTAVLDLEDGVAPADKDRARSFVVACLADTDRQVAVRINHPSTQRGLVDAASVINAGGRILVLPKTETAAEIDAIVKLAGGVEEICLIVTIETARGVLALAEIFACSSVAAVGWGPYDLASDMGLRAVRNSAGELLAPLSLARDQILLNAAAARIAALDTVTTELRDVTIVKRDAVGAAMLGFQGKFAIHPSQVDVIRQSFQPSGAELEWCRRLLAAAPAQGVFLFEGEMIDEPILRRAKRTIALAERNASAVAT